MRGLSKSVSEGGETDGAPLRRLVQKRGHRLVLRAAAMALAAAGLTAGALALAASLTAPEGPAPQAMSAAVLQSWSEIIRPIALYDLSGTDFAKLPRSYRARRHAPDGAREDVLTFGTLGAPKPYLQLSLLRAGRTAAGTGSHDPEAADNLPLADDLARLAGSRNETVARIGEGGTMTTRLGLIEAADLLLWDAGASTPCIGFRGEVGGRDGLRIGGFACGAAGKPVGRAGLACAIDRIDLVSAGEDRRLRAIFVAAEREPSTSCDGSGVRSAGGLMTAVGARVSWLDGASDPPAFRGIMGAGTR